MLEFGEKRRQYYAIGMLPKQKKQWVNWKLEAELKEGIPTGKFTKVPYQPNGLKADSTKKITWSTYEEVKQVAHAFSGIGIVFDGSMLGVDLDHVLNGGIIEDEASEKFVEASNTLVEISPSGDGLHVFFQLSEPLSLTAHTYKPNERVKYECYTEKRYFTVTENIYKKYENIRTIDSVEAKELLSMLGYPWKKKVNNSTVVSEKKSTLTDAEILSTMFRASNAAKAKAIYEGDNNYHEGDASSADMALCCLLAFYSNKDAETIERIWLASPRGKRNKVRERKDYRTRTIGKAIEATVEVFRADNSFDAAEDYVKRQIGSGETIPLITENIQVFLNSYKDFAGCFRFNEFSQRIEYKHVGVWRDYRDSDAIIIQTIISRAHPLFFRVSKGMVEDAVMANALRNAYDPVREFFKTLIWDKKLRLNTWLHKTYDVPDDDLHRAIGSNWLKGLVKRAMEPGCKFDYVLVLEAPQGAKKSMSLAVLGNPWHTETVFTPDSKDFFMLLFGNLIVEFSEGETLSRSDVKKLKAVITMQHDDIRLPYDRVISRHPRRCVFAMTTNEEQYLKDDTGNRRWLPVKVGAAIDIEWLSENRDQLFAEAYHRAIELKEPIHEFPQEEMEQAQRERMIVDPQEEKIADWYQSLSTDTRAEGVTTREAFLGISPTQETFGGGMSKLDEIRIGSVFRNTLFLQKKRKKINGIFRNMYFMTHKTEASFNFEVAKNFELV
jgi:predicted P-loop ATPase